MLRTLAPLLCALPLAAQALCTSDDTPPVNTLVERFIDADCFACWQERAAAPAAADALVLDWIVPNPDAGVAPALPPSDDALERLQTLRRRPPARMDTVTSRREGEPVQLRVAHGETFNDYVGVSIAMERPGRDPWQAWLLLVEKIPAGVDGSPVARTVVRKVFRPEGWARTRQRAAPLEETRSMQLPRGAVPERLRLVALAQDGRGHMRAITQSECRH